MFNFFSKSKEPIKLWFSTDIHCHIIPGVDDGSPDVDTSVGLVERMMEMGLERIIPSPHVTAVTFENNVSVLDPAFELLRTELKRKGMGDSVTVYGAENRVDELFQKNFSEGTLITHPGKFVLIENAFIQEPWDLDNTIFDLCVRGFKPVMAHPERFVYYHQRPERLRELHEKVPFQVNVLSLAGYYGNTVKKMADKMVDAGLVDYLGTDFHGVRHTDCVNAYLATRDARRHRDALSGKIRNDRDFGD